MCRGTLAPPPPRPTTCTHQRDADAEAAESRYQEFVCRAITRDSEKSGRSWSVPYCSTNEFLVSRQENSPAAKNADFYFRFHVSDDDTQAHVKKWYGELA